MVIDSSAIIAILQLEPEELKFLAAIDAAAARLMSVVSWVESSMVILGRRGHAGLRDLDAFIARARIDIVPVQRRHAELAREAFIAFGKGRHPAALNCGDCFSYALAKATGEPLLFKGDDFSRTDLRRAVG
jgi:ribonuclease VapC